MAASRGQPRVPQSVPVHTAACADHTPNHLNLRLRASESALTYCCTFIDDEQPPDEHAAASPHRRHCQQG